MVELGLCFGFTVCFDIDMKSKGKEIEYLNICAGVAKLADALDLGSSEATRGGSSPLSGTTNKGVSNG